MRRLTRRVRGFVISFAAFLPLLPVSAETTQPAGTPVLSIADPETGRLIGAAYVGALKNLLEINNVAYDTHYNSTGFLPATGTFFRAGGGYAQPWTRDASVNSWNAGSQFAPDVARNTLWAVVKKQNPDAPDSLIVQQDSQWWDQVVWIPAAWNHYLVTGDREFLKRAYVTAVNTLERRHSVNFNSKYGLYQGPSFFNDGIAGYPDSIAGTEYKGSFVDGDYPKARTQMALSTNALYYQAYRVAADMAKELGGGSAKAETFLGKAAALKIAINKYLWDSGRGTYGYTLVKRDSEEVWDLEKYQEGTGVSFALMFGIPEDAQAVQVLKNTKTMPWGITDVYPYFPRYSDEKPGRHNNIIWPMIQGFWAQAAAERGDQRAFTDEILRLAWLYRNADDDFAEVYDAMTGKVCGGNQCG
jgi:hypothetical protein